MLSNRTTRCRTNSNLGNCCCCCWWPLRSCRVNVRCTFLCVGSWAKKSISRGILHSFIVRIRWLSIRLRLHNHNNKRWNVWSMLQREEKWWRAARLWWKIRNLSEIPHTSALIVIPPTITFTLQPPHAIITPTTTTFRALGFAADDYVRIDIERLTWLHRAVHNQIVRALFIHIGAESVAVMDSVKQWNLFDICLAMTLAFIVLLSVEERGSHARKLCNSDFSSMRFGFNVTQLHCDTPKI